MDEQNCWSFSCPFIPPGNNHQYAPIGIQGQKALTREARELRDHITLLARRSGFEPQPQTRYAVAVVFTFPGQSQDIDSPIKSLLDATFGTRADQWVMWLSVEKRVEPGCRQTDVTIREIPG